MFFIKYKYKLFSSYIQKNAKYKATFNLNRYKMLLLTYSIYRKQRVTDYIFK